MYYEIVPMDRSHISQIAALERQCFSSPWSETMLADALFDVAHGMLAGDIPGAGALRDMTPTPPGNWERQLGWTPTPPAG